MKALPTLATLSWLLVFPAVGFAQTAVDDVALARAFLSLPPLAQMQALAQVPGQEAAQSLPGMANPVFSARQEQGIGPAAGFSTTAVGATFSFDLVGKQALRDTIRRKDSARHRHPVDRYALDGVCRIRHAALALEHLAQQTDILNDVLARYQWLLETVEALAKGQEKSRFDVRRAAWRVSAQEERLTALDAQLGALQATLATLTGAPVDPTVRVTLPDQLVPLDQLLEAARTRHPDLAVANVDLQVARASQVLASRAWVPDLGLYGAYRLDVADQANDVLHGYELGVSMEVPIFRCGEHEELEARVALARATFEKQRTWLLVKTAVSTRHAAATRLLQSDLTQSQDASDAATMWSDATAAYREGTVVLGELVELLQAEQDRALARLQRRAEARRAVLDTYCAAGIFPESELNDWLYGARQ